jgi:RNA polymerase sigma-70 factor (ECF subfamily)
VDSTQRRDALEASTAERSDTASARLLARARDGDASALDALVARYLPALRRWAHGRLPPWARGFVDTGDIVQDVLLRTFQRFGGFQPQGQKALQAYLRQAVSNRICDEKRRVGRRPVVAELDSGHPGPGPSPLGQAIEAESAQLYLRALKRLREEDRQLVVARVELDYSYEQLALLSGRTPDAARMAVRRAVVRLAEEMAAGA